jgi:transposase
MDHDGEVIARDDVSSDPNVIAVFIAARAPDVERVVHESGILAIWLTRELEKRGVPIICIDARLAHKALSGRINKSDRGDAEGLAHLARTGWYSEVHIRSEASERVRVIIGARERLIRMRKDLEAHVRGVLKVFGVCMGTVGTKDLRQRFRDQLAAASDTDPAIELMADMFIPLHKTLCASADAVTEELHAIARDSALTQRLMTVPGVGPITALAYITTLDDAARFKKSIDVGAFLGLTPRRHQSGDMDWSGRISKCGDRNLRSLLYAAGSTLINCTRKPSSLKAWATRLCARKGHKKAAVAVARKLAVILHSIWRDETIFDPGTEAIA